MRHRQGQPPHHTRRTTAPVPCQGTDRHNHHPAPGRARLGAGFGVFCRSGSCFEGTMSERWILVDGYSVLHAWARFRTRKMRALSLRQRREVLVGYLRQFADQSGQRVTVVFDGYAAKHKPEGTEPLRGVEVVFSERGKTADDVIERLVAQAEQKAHIQVVTSDHMERRTVETLGAHSLSAEIFEGEVDAVLRDLALAVRQHSPKSLRG